MKKFYISIILIALGFYFSACKKTAVTVVDFSTITTTDNECRITADDSTDWTNDIIWSLADTNRLVFNDTFAFADTLTGKIAFSPACPNPSNGLFICNITPQRQCKMKVVCVNTNFDLLYFNTYLLNAEPITLGFDFREATAFHKGNNYRMYYAFYTSRDSMYYRGHGDFKIQ